MLGPSTTIIYYYENNITKLFSCKYGLIFLYSLISFNNFSFDLDFSCYFYCLLLSKFHVSFIYAVVFILFYIFSSCIKFCAEKFVVLVIFDGIIMCLYLYIIAWCWIWFGHVCSKKHSSVSLSIFARKHSICFYWQSRWLWKFFFRIIYLPLFRDDWNRECFNNV